MLGLLGIPSIISSMLTFATPILSGLLKFSSWFLSELWVGLKDILDNLSTVITVATIAAIAVLYGTSLAECAIVGPVFPEDPSTPWRFDWNR